jgi:hypothetical protein
MKTLDEMTLDELRALEIERYQKYTDQYDHAGPDAAKQVRYFEVVAVIDNRLKRELDRGLVAEAASEGTDESQQTNGVHATPISMESLSQGESIEPSIPSLDPPGDRVLILDPIRRDSILQGLQNAVERPGAGGNAIVDRDAHVGAAQE